MKVKVLCRVEYYDHAYADDEGRARPILCRDVGFFVGERRTDTGVPYFVFAAGLADDGDFNRPFNVILKRAVVKLTAI